ncbi:MAG: cysteine desulfurase [Bdellovibrionaceae bacterium]|nr:cysteine desulfurase [Bdellovibrio sp.]
MNDPLQNQSLTSRNVRIYLDHNATTPPAPVLAARWSELLFVTGNPSSIHNESRMPKAWLRETRQKFANYLNCSPLEIIFNSGASEGNSSILKSAWQLRNQNRNEIIVSQVEHPSVIKTAEHLQAQGAIVHWVPVDRAGLIDLDFIKNKLSEKTLLVSVMFANNETGSIFPIKEIAALAHQAGALMHADCVQLLGKYNLEQHPEKLKIFDLDYATFSAHKFYALAGTGVVFIKKNSPWVPLVHGGGQERGRRGGTENVLGIASLGIVLDELKAAKVHVDEMLRLRNLLESSILARIDGCTITAAEGARLANTSSLVMTNVDGETLLMSLDLKGFSVSTGAACSSGNPEPSPVLLAMGLSRIEAQSSLRISLGWQTTEEQIILFVNTLVEVVAKLREINLTGKDLTHAVS